MGTEASGVGEADQGEQVCAGGRDDLGEEAGGVGAVLGLFLRGMFFQPLHAFTHLHLGECCISSLIHLIKSSILSLTHLLN